MRDLNYPKIFGLGGAVLAEIYMLYTVLAPLQSGQPVPWDYQIKRVLVAGIFFGVFGALVGTGIGLLVGGLMRKR
jgi:hypothetical protein